MKRLIHPLLLPVLFTVVACSGEEAADPAPASPAGQQSKAPVDNAAQVPNQTTVAGGDTGMKAQGAKSDTRQNRSFTTRPGALSANPTAEMRSLVPADAFLWAELDSIDRLEDLMLEISDLMPEVPMPPPQMMLSSLSNFGIDPSEVRSDAPLGFALSMGEGMEPAPTFVINVRNAASLAAKLQGAPGMPTPRSSGNAVAVPLHETYTPDAEHGQMLSTGLPKGSIRFRVHIAYLVDALGDQLQQGMSMAKSMASAQAGSDSAGALLENQMDQGVEMIEGMRFLSLGLDLEEGNLDLAFAMTMNPDSPFADLGEGTGRDLAELAQYVSDEDAFVMLGSLTRQHLDQLVRPMIDGMALNTGYEEGIQLRAAYSGFEGILGQAGSSFAMIGHVDRGATDISAILHGIDADLAADQMSGVLDGFKSLGESLVSTQPVKGLESGSRFLQYDFVPSPQAVTTAGGREDLSNLASYFGASRVRVRAVTQGDEALISLGEGTSLAAKVAQSEEGVEGELAWALDSIHGRSPALLYRMDVNRLSHGLARCADGNGYLEPMPSNFDVKLPLGQVPPFYVTTWLVLEDSLWEGGVRLNLGAAAELGRQGALGSPLAR